ncbi:amidohydrolase family protein [Candidatus Electronema sp. PJ]|uniref:amidohydrolase family protein n=1 Tax=Candidatus Electronema sp. PJ TaxID=3401572 RepID=UPI003AA948B4
MKGAMICQMIKKMKLFDAHFHIIDSRFPLVPNNGFLPDEFTCADYLERMRGYNLLGGAIVSGSFQAFDQSYIADALPRLGPAFVGVTQLPENTSDKELLRLHSLGVRAVRFNLHRGGSEDVHCLERMSKRVHEIVGWHVELYADAKGLAELRGLIASLPSVSIDHLGLSAEGFPTLLWLAEHGVKIKATGFGRGNLAVKNSLRDIYSANPDALMFGTDLPSTRAARPYTDEDFLTVIEALGEDNAQRVCYDNAFELYRP